MSLANLRVAAVSSPFSIRKAIPLVYTCNEKTNLHDEAAVSFRVGKSLVVLLVAVRGLFHSCVLPAGPDRKRNRTTRVDSFAELLSSLKPNVRSRSLRSLCLWGSTKKLNVVDWRESSPPNAQGRFTRSRITSKLRSAFHFGEGVRL